MDAVTEPSQNPLRHAAENLAHASSAATRGPWSWTGNTLLPELTGHEGDPDVYEYETEVLEVRHSDGGGFRCCETELLIGEADKAYIAAVNPLVGQAVARVLEEAASIDFTETGLEGLGWALDLLSGTLLAPAS